MLPQNGTPGGRIRRKQAPQKEKGGKASTKTQGYCAKAAADLLGTPRLYPSGLTGLPVGRYLLIGATLELSGSLKDVSKEDLLVGCWGGTWGSSRQNEIY